MIKMDFIKAFHSVPIEETDQKFYGFLGNEGTIYKYIVLPMGTRNSPALFSEYMEKSLSDIKEKYPSKIRIYQDDVAICGSSANETLEIATMVKTTMKLAGLVCNNDKTYWDPVSTKPLLGAIWAPMRLTQKPEDFSMVMRKGPWPKD
eukprot:GHVP01038325.1.p1 GENE.GHVP01038325.1~~GHVP01038325.1.p1  ORF type:complete len:148 (-),score=22.21 GHVP01038325.1:583-1026(-)